MVVGVSVAECVKYDSYLIYNVLRKSLGNINFILKKGSTVLLKPNILNQSLPEKATVTHYTVVDAVCRILHEGGCKILIGESSGNPLGYGGTKKAFQTSNIKSVADKYNAKIIVFEGQKLIKKEINGKILKNIVFSDVLNDVDCIINLPKLKTHVYTNYTGAIKNTFGFVPGALKVRYHKMGSNLDKFVDIILDIYSNLVPDLNIMDAIVGMEGDGPSAGIPKETGLLLVSKNAIALDIIAQGIIGLPKKQQVITNRAIERGLFNSEIEIIGRVPSINYKKSSDKIRKLPSFLRRFIDSQGMYKIQIDSGVCRKCGACVKSCPQQAISMKNYPSIKYNKCIRCYCCHELCPYGAVKFKEKLLLRLARKIPKLKVFGV